MSLARIVSCPVVARYRHPVPLGTLQKFEAGWAVSALNSGVVVILDHELQLVRTIDVTGVGWVPERSEISLSADGMLVAVSSPRGVRVATVDGTDVAEFQFPARWPSHAKGGLRWSTDGMLWFACPTEEATDRGGLRVLDATRNEIVADGDLPGWMRGSMNESASFTRVPNENSMLITVHDALGMCRIFRADLRAGSCIVSRLPLDGKCVAADDAVRADGAFFVAGPHPEGRDEITIHDTRNGGTIVTMRYADLGDDPLTPEFGDPLSHTAFYLSNDTLVATLHLGRILAIDVEPMRIRGVISPHGVQPFSADAPAEFALHPWGVTPNGRLVVEQDRHRILLVDPGPVRE